MFDVIINDRLLIGVSRSLSFKRYQSRLKLILVPPLYTDETSCTCCSTFMLLHTNLFNLVSLITTYIRTFALQDLPQQPIVSKISPNYQQVMSPQQMASLEAINRNSIPVPVINIIQAQTPNEQIIRNSTPIQTRIMSPLTLKVSSPMYSLPPSPNTSNYTSPAMSPVQRDHLLSPYSTPQSLSPVGKYNQSYSPNSRHLSPVSMMHGYDPYLSNKMQTSPGFPLQSDMLLDTMSLSSPDFWGETDIIQGTSELLTAFDDVKLV